MPGIARNRNRMDAVHLIRRRGTYPCAVPSARHGPVKPPCRATSEGGSSVMRRPSLRANVTCCDLIASSRQSAWLEKSVSRIPPTRISTARRYARLDARERSSKLRRSTSVFGRPLPKRDNVGLCPCNASRDTSCIDAKKLLGKTNASSGPSPQDNIVPTALADSELRIGPPKRRVPNRWVSFHPDQLNSTLNTGVPSVHVAAHSRCKHRVRPEDQATRECVMRGSASVRGVYPDGIVAFPVQAMRRPLVLVMRRSGLALLLEHQATRPANPS